MKKRRSHDELRKVAIDAAYDIIAADGIAGLNIRRVAVAIDCSVGSIYNIFKDIEDIERHVAVRILANLSEALFCPMLPIDGLECLQAIAARYISFAFDHPRLWSMLFDTRMTADRPPPDWHREAIQSLAGEAERLAAIAFQNTDVDVKTSTEVIWASIHGIATLGLSGKLGFLTTGTATFLADTLVKTYVAGAKTLSA